MEELGPLKEGYDEQVVNQVLSGKIEQYELLMRKYNGYLYKVGKSYGFGHADIEDLMQETYVKAYTHLGDFQGRSSLKTWLVQIMIHECYHKKHKKSYLREKSDSDHIEENAKTLFQKNSVNGFKELQNDELKTVIEDAIMSIGEKYRQVFILRELTGLSTAETAQVLHISETNVKARLNRAKEKLREEIEHTYSTEELFEFNLIHCDGLVERVLADLNGMLI